MIWTTESRVMKNRYLPSILAGLLVIHFFWGLWEINWFAWQVGTYVWEQMKEEPLPVPLPDEHVIAANDCVGNGNNTATFKNIMCISNVEVFDVQKR